MISKVPCSMCNDTEECDSGGTQPWGEAINIPCSCSPIWQDNAIWWPFAHYEPFEGARILIKVLGNTDYHMERVNQYWRYCPTAYPYMPSLKRKAQHKSISTPDWKPIPVWRVSVYDKFTQFTQNLSYFRRYLHASLVADTLHVENQARHILITPIHVYEVGGAMRVVSSPVELRDHV